MRNSNNWNNIRVPDVYEIGTNILYLMDMSKSTTSALEKLTKEIEDVREMEGMFKSESSEVKNEEKVSSYKIKYV